MEYGTDVMEMHVGAVEAGERALVVDDLIATGGTLCAAIRLLGSVVNFKSLNFFTDKCHLTAYISYILLLVCLSRVLLNYNYFSARLWSTCSFE